MVARKNDRRRREIQLVTPRRARPAIITQNSILVSHVVGASATPRFSSYSLLLPRHLKVPVGARHLCNADTDVTRRLRLQRRGLGPLLGRSRTPRRGRCRTSGGKRPLRRGGGSRASPDLRTSPRAQCYAAATGSRTWRWDRKQAVKQRRGGRDFCRGPVTCRSFLMQSWPSIGRQGTRQNLSS